MTGRKLALVVVAAVVAVALVVTVVVLGGRGGSPGTASPAGSAAASVGPADATLPEQDLGALVSAVPAREVAKVEPVRLADGVVPPSNRWYSGLVFGEEPQPVFAEPLSFALTGSGFTLGLPAVVASEAAVVAPHVPALTVDVGAASARVSAADPVSVTVELLDGAGEVLGRVVLAEGSPFVSLTADRDVTVRTTGGTFTGSGEDASAATSTVGETTWGLVAPGLEGGDATLADGDTAAWYALPDDATDATADVLATAAADPVTGVDVAYGVDDTVARTTLTYETAGGAPSAYVLMPHHRAGEQPAREDCGLGTYPSVYGDLELCAGSTLTSFAPAVPPVGTLDLDGVPQERTDAVLEALRADVAATPAFPSDTYFGGKALFRAATLVTLGEQLGAPDEVADLREKTVAALREWTEPDGCTRRDARCVVYDPTARSVIGLTPSFGSDELNDHHFHYGYLLAAAGLLAADDAALADDLAPVMDLLAADVAAATGGAELPQLRSFDPYAGHSWASGTAPFADGNNQESSSEAVNAWNGLGLWAVASGQDDLAAEATWLASTEALAARTYWTAPDLTPFEGFGHTMVSLNWGGKRDFATWFSPDPNAIVGIQLIPMGAVQRSTVLGVTPEQVRATVAEGAPDGYDVQFGGYLLEYLALAGAADADEAWDAAVGLGDVAIDDGTSRAATLAFIAAAAAHPPLG